MGIEQESACRVPFHQGEGGLWSVLQASAASNCISPYFAADNPISSFAKSTTEEVQVPWRAKNLLSGKSQSSMNTGLGLCSLAAASVFHARKVSARGQLMYTPKSYR